MDMKVARGSTDSKTFEPTPASPQERSGVLATARRHTQCVPRAPCRARKPLHPVLGQGVFVPILLGVMASYALTPVVDWLERWRLPRVLGSAFLLLSIVGGIGWTAYRLSDDAADLVASLPESLRSSASPFRSRRQKACGRRPRSTRFNRPPANWRRPRR